MQRRRDPAPVEQEDRLASALGDLAELGEKRRGERIPRLAAEVDRAHHRAADADALAELKPLESLPALGARRGASVDRHGALERGSLRRHRPRVIARVGLLLVPGVVLLVDADHTEPGERREHGRARTDHDRRRPGGDALPLVAPFRLGQRRVQDRDAVAETRPEAAHGLRRERDLRDEHDHAEPALERVGCSLEGDLGLAAPGRSVQEKVPASFAERTAQPGERTLLRCGQSPRLGLTSQRIAFGRLRQLLAASAPRRSDERQRPPGRRPVVVREPERELDERRRQRLDDALDRSGLHSLGRRVLEADHDPTLPRPTEPHCDDRAPPHVVRDLVRERTRQRAGRHERVDRGVLRHAPQATPRIRLRRLR